MLSSLAPARRRLAFAVICASAAALVAVLAVVIAHGSGPRSHRVAQSDLGPVLLVPGYGGSVTSLQSLASTLRASGRVVDVVTLPGNALGDLDGQAVALGRAAAAAVRSAGASAVDIVGYSAGGVVARLWVRDHGGASLARRVITLGSPQHGTELAALGGLVPSACPTACQQLAPDSDVLAALNRGTETPAGPQWVSIWTTRDNVVVPADSARLAGAVNVTVQSLCPADTVDHSGLPNDPVVQRIVSAELAGASVSTPTAGC
jgi:triacylglycerol esterase/lipase EstA (alpha/beta hydrolase family)